MTSLINVRKNNLKKNGYNNINDWLKNKNHIYIGRKVMFVDDIFQSK